ncbi:hypothetical protein N374_gp078 [Bacillus phage phiNIT1]|uniref:Uncharacterized protein n=1 Tax=Bacillus phage phiNIT1 TaxID=207656 RepID=S6ATQ4_9CAUD|nr:hypothetical protein N374_gp078 [Bacillus phage phiNIT1]BAN59611.1 hypothetical protein [Bacillus phage phiNIT1]
MELDRELSELGYRIRRAIHHGECFYEESELLSFLSELKKLEELTKKHYAENQEERLDD